MSHKSKPVFTGTGYRKGKKLWIIVSAILGLILATGIFWIVAGRRGMFSGNRVKVSDLYDLWNHGAYERVYAAASDILDRNPLQYTALTFKGYSAYYLSVAQSDAAAAQPYLDESINSLRIALRNSNRSAKPQIEYVLGKAYYQKDALAGYHYYADLAVHYLDSAFEQGFHAADLAEYRGLSYASLGMVEESIAAFTEALTLNPTDMLLAAIGEQYYNLKDYEHAKQYLFRVIQESPDEALVLKCQTVLGNLYLIEENYIDAQKEFSAILEKSQNSADAYYGLGVIYEKQGDLVKARSEWRKALKIQPNHTGAQQKLSS